LTQIKENAFSVSNPLHFFEQDFLTAAVIKLGGSAVGVAGDTFGRLQWWPSFFIFQKILDTGSPK
jgi:hypothetical protein